jgi:excisionase family DNA binding protein
MERTVAAAGGLVESFGGTRRPVPCEVAVTVDLGLLVERIAAEVAARLAVPEASPWLDVAGAAEYLSCSPERIRKLIARREIPFHQERPGSRVFFHRRELDEWLLSL